MEVALILALATLPAAFVLGNRTAKRQPRHWQALGGGGKYVEVCRAEVLASSPVEGGQWVVIYRELDMDGQPWAQCYACEVYEFQAKFEEAQP